jgi:hypothetical protein
MYILYKEDFSELVYHLINRMIVDKRQVIAFSASSWREQVTF